MIADPKFIHLRVHSAYSLLEGALPIKQIAALCRQFDMPAVAVTDTNNLFGALELSETLADEGVQPIIGCTLSIDMEVDGTKSADDPKAAANPNAQVLYKLALIAKDEQGYQNLMKLSSCAFLEPAETAAPHITFVRLKEYSAGLICLTGGPGGPINDALVHAQTDLAKSRLETLHTVFG
ncbi:MAG: PHP domain-containing protein, partial [Hyphomicrobiales bacterium]